MANFTLPSVPYSYDALEPHIDARTMEIHHTKHHQAYTDGLNKALSNLGPEWQNKNDIVGILKDIDSIPDNARGAVNFHGGGYSNHTLFWNNMKNGGGGEPDAELSDAINKTFGSFNDFKDKKSHPAFGSGCKGTCLLSQVPKPPSRLCICLVECG